MEKLIVKETLVAFMVNELDSDKRIFLRLVSLFSKTLFEFAACNCSVDAQKMGELAHKVRPACRQFGAVKLEDLFAKIEKLVLHNGSAEEIKELSSLANSLVEATILELTQISNEVFERKAKSA